MERPEPLVIDGVRFARWGPPAEREQFQWARANYRWIEIVGSLWISLLACVSQTAPPVSLDDSLSILLFRSQLFYMPLGVVALVWALANFVRFPSTAAQRGRSFVKFYIRSSTVTIAEELGTLRVDRDLLHFESRDLAFAIHQTDVSSALGTDLFASHRGSMTLIHPEGCPSLKLEYLRQEPHFWRPDQKADSETVRSALMQWSTADRTSPSILPPIELAPEASSPRCHRARTRMWISGSVVALAYVLIEPIPLLSLTTVGIATVMVAFQIAKKKAYRRRVANYFANKMPLTVESDLTPKIHVQA